MPSSHVAGIVLGIIVGILLVVVAYLYNERNKKHAAMRSATDAGLDTPFV
jgi:hypothetical protein